MANKYQELLKRMYEEVQAGYRGEQAARDDREAKYGKQRSMSPEEQQNMLAGIQGQSVYNPYASANAGADFSKLRTQSSPQSKSSSNLYRVDPRFNESPYDEGTSIHDKIYDPKQFAISDYLRANEGTTVAPLEIQEGMAGRIQQAMLMRNVDEWDAIRARLNKDWEKFDGIAKSQIDQLDNQTEALNKARDSGALSEMQYMEEIGRIGRVAKSYKWDAHERAPGSQVGDIVIDNGIGKIRTKDGFKSEFFTKDYITEHTVAVRDEDGNVIHYSVPSAPGQKPNIVTPVEKKLSDAGYDKDDQNQIRESLSRNLAAIQRSRVDPDPTPEAVLDEVNQAMAVTFQQENAIRNLQKGLTEGKMPELMEPSSIPTPGADRGSAEIDKIVQGIDFVTGEHKRQQYEETAQMLKDASTLHGKAEVMAARWRSLPYMEHLMANPIPYVPGRKPMENTVVVLPNGQKFFFAGGVLHPIDEGIGNVPGSEQPVWR